MNLFDSIINSAKSWVNYLASGQLWSDAYDWANPETQDPIQRFLDDPAQDMSKKQALMDNLKSGVPKEVMKSYVSEKYYKPVELKQTVSPVKPLFPKSGEEWPATAALKTFGNIPTSLYNFGASATNLASTAYQEGIPETAWMLARWAVKMAGQWAENVATSYRNQWLIGATNTVLEWANKFMMENPIDVVWLPWVWSLAMKWAKSGSQAIVRWAEALWTTAKTIPQTIVNAGWAVVKTPKTIVRSGVNALEKIKPGIKDDLAGIDPQSRYAVERATPERVSSIIEEAKQAKMSPDADYQQTPYHKGAEMANKTVEQIEWNLRKRQAERMAILEDVPLEKVNLENVRNSLREELDKLNIEDITIDDAGKPVVVSKKWRSALLDQKNSQDMQAIEKLREVLSEDVSPLQTMDNIKILQEWLYENKGTIALKGISKKMEGIVSKIQWSMNKTFKDQLPPQYKKVMDSMSEDIQMNEKIKRLFGIGDDGNPVWNRGELVMKRLTNGTTTGGEARALAKEILDKYWIDLVQEARLRQLSMELVGDTRWANLFWVLLSGKKWMMDWTLWKVWDVLIDKENLIKSYAGKWQIVKPKKQPNLYTKPTKNGTPLRNTKNSSPIPDTKWSTKPIVRPSPKPIIKPNSKPNESKVIKPTTGDTIPEGYTKNAFG